MLYHAALVAALATAASSHGLITSIEGANGVAMPGLSVADGTPRDCSTNRCGSQADTAIIRDREMGEVGPLGRTQGNGPVRAEDVISNFMGSGSGAPTNDGANESVGVEDDIPANAQRKKMRKRQLRDLIGGFFGGGSSDDDDDSSSSGGGGGTGLGGLFGGGGNSDEGPPESSISASAGAGASDGLPTCADDGTITMTFRQINQDGAGPMDAAVDGTSGGTDPDAFQTAEVTQDVPGVGFGGLSLATSTDFPLEVRMPEGMTCDGTVAGVDNVCVVRVRNGAAAGPFGGSAAFTQSAGARKRAIAYRLRKRMEIGGRV